MILPWRIPLETLEAELYAKPFELISLVVSDNTHHINYEAYATSCFGVNCSGQFCICVKT